MTFIPETAVLTAFTLIALVVIIAPGPDMTFFLGKTLSNGRRAGFAAYLGASVGLVVHTALAAFGLSALLAASDTAFMALKFAGALYLAWLAVDALRNGSALRLDAGGREAQPLMDVFMLGVGINLLNPKIVLFFMTFLPQFVSAGDPSAPARLMFLGLWFIALAVPVCAALILAADRVAMALRRSPRVTRIIDWVFASVLAAFAAKLLLEPERG